MLKDKHTIIISTDALQAYGLKLMLEEYFSLNKAEVITDLAAIEKHTLSCDLLFVQAKALYALYDRQPAIRSKLIVISDMAADNAGSLPMLNVAQGQADLLESLSELLAEKLDSQKHQDNRQDLSEREREVLALIAKGDMNKTIADKLHISLNTVLTHRKNITAKLGIKTVSGLTVYAILNGMISADEV